MASSPFLVSFMTREGYWTSPTKCEQIPVGPPNVKIVLVHKSYGK